jgi:hypothetical protein
LGEYPQLWVKATKILLVGEYTQRAGGDMARFDFPAG